MLVHEGDRFFQWLEGPSAALDVLWTSICRDPRHEDVELLGEGVTPTRLFSDWDLRFLERDAGRGVRGCGPSVGGGGDAEPEEAAPVALARLALAGDDAGILNSSAPAGRAGEDAETLCRALFEPAAHQLGDWWCDGRLQQLRHHPGARTAAEPGATL